MNTLAIITLFTTLITLYYKVTKHIADSIVYFIPFDSDYYRLKDDLTKEKDKDLKAFTFSIIIICVISFILYLLSTNIKEFDSLILVMIGGAIGLLSLGYITFVFYCKGKKIMSVQKKGKTFYLHSQIDKDTYLFKDSTFGNYKSLMTLSKEDMINSFSGYVEVNPTKNKGKLLKQNILSIFVFFVVIYTVFYFLFPDITIYKNLISSVISTFVSSVFIIIPQFKKALNNKKRTSN